MPPGVTPSWAECVHFGADLAGAQGCFDTLFFARRERQALEVDGGAFLAAGQALQSVTNFVQKWLDIACRHLRRNRNSV